jgi:hypothetical protein
MLFPDVVEDEIRRSTGWCLCLCVRLSRWIFEGCELYKASFKRSGCVYVSIFMRSLSPSETELANTRSVLQELLTEPEIEDIPRLARDWVKKTWYTDGDGKYNARDISESLHSLRKQGAESFLRSSHWRSRFDFLVPVYKVNGS